MSNRDLLFLSHFGLKFLNNMVQPLSLVVHAIHQKIAKQKLLTKPSNPTLDVLRVMNQNFGLDIFTWPNFSTTPTTTMLSK